MYIIWCIFILIGFFLLNCHWAILVFIRNGDLQCLKFYPKIVLPHPKLFMLYNHNTFIHTQNAPRNQTLQIQPYVETKSKKKNYNNEHIYIYIFGVKQIEKKMPSILLLENHQINEPSRTVRIFMYFSKEQWHFMGTRKTTYDVTYIHFVVI